MEERFGSKWRKGFSSSEKKHFSRTKQVVEAVFSAAEAKSAREGTAMDCEAILDEFDLIFQEEAKKSLSKMVSLLQERGSVPKLKARGKNTQQ